MENTKEISFMYKFQNDKWIGKSPLSLYAFFFFKIDVSLLILVSDNISMIALILEDDDWIIGVAREKNYWEISFTTSDRL